MLEYTIRLSAGPSTTQELRLFEGSNPIHIKQRPLASDSLSALLRDVETSYQFSHLLPDLQTLESLGRRLADWLDDPQHRWLEFLLAHNEPVTLRIDVGEGLRHLPWELLFRDGFLCQRAGSPLHVVRLASSRKGDAQPQNRPLRVLMMASAPEGQSSLDFEAEEAMILQATSEQSIDLVVEESGTLAGLKQRVSSHKEGHFDVLHLTGHADIQDRVPVFLAENDLGEPEPVTAEQLAEALGERWPRLIFLSACRTGQSPDQGQLPSLCEALIQRGAPAVLGWGLPVEDPMAMRTAAILYGSLATGDSIARAIGLARTELLRQKSPRWHLLRAYSDHSPLSAPVTPLEHEGREILETRPAAEFFLGSDGKMPVCSREDFVGRRRPLQRCLRQLQPSQRSVQGVLLHGIGGLGKSSLAARIVERLPRLSPVVLVGNMDESALVRALCDSFPKAITFFQDPAVQSWPLTARLQELLKRQLIEPLLLILDDFEHAFDPDNVSAGPNVAALEVVEAFLHAIRQTGSSSRLLITCRYDFSPREPFKLHKESLEGVRGADLTKKVTRLDLLNELPPNLSADLRARALRVGAGNPRLLERLWALLKTNPASPLALLTELEAKGEEYREELLLARILEQAGPECARLLAWAATYQIPVEREALEVVAGGVKEEALNQARVLGLLEAGEVSTEARSSTRYHVPNLLRPLLEGKLGEEEQMEAARRGCRHLRQRWEQENNRETVGEAAEIHRLALVAQERAIAVQMMMVLAQVQMAVSQNRKARALVEATMERMGKDHRLLILLARAETQLGETRGAEEHFREGLRLCPQDEGSQQHRASALHGLAGMLAQQGKVDEAMNFWSQSLDIFERIGDVKGKAATLHSMAVVLAQQGKVDEALDLWSQSLEIFEHISDVHGMAATLYQMAGVSAQQGKVDEALKLWRQSLELNERIGDVHGKAATLNKIAGVLAKNGNIDQALKLWNQTLDIFERIGHVQGLASTMNNMAEVLMQKGSIHEAMNLWTHSFELKNRISDVQGQAATLSNMAGVWAQQGILEKALEGWQQSLELNKILDDLKGQAATIHNVAGVFAQNGKVDEAMALWTQSLKLNERIDNVHGKATTLHEMARILVQQGNVDQAMDFWSQSLDIFERICNMKGRAVTLSSMAGALAQQDKVDEAMALWTQSLGLAECIGDVQIKATTLHNMAGVLAQQGKIDEAMALWTQSLDIFERIGDVHGKAATLHQMAAGLVHQGILDKALELWQQSLDLSERIGNVHGKAATLGNMAGVARQRGDLAEEQRLACEAARLLASIRAWPDLLTVLSNLGVGEGPQALPCLLQACWLALLGLAPVRHGLEILEAALQRLGEQDDLAPALSVAKLVLLQSQGLLSSEQREMLESLRKALEDRVPPDSWLFERSLLENTLPNQDER